jgi:CBS domain containing-hemolysin-like protein
MVEIIFIVISLLLVLACSLFVAAEFSFVTVDKARVQRLADKGDKRAAGVLSGLRTLSTQLSGAQIGITITNLAIGFLAEPAISELLHGPLQSLGLPGKIITAISVVVGISLATIVTMLFGELVPKNLAIARPIETSRAIQGWQRRFTALMHYPIVLMNGVANKIVRRLGVEPQEELASARSVEELLSVVKHSARRGTLAKDTAVLLERSLEFSERHASDVMTPRVKLEVVNADGSILSVLEAVRNTGFSRFPVIDKEIDNVVGLIQVKHAVAVPFNDRDSRSVRSVMQPVTFIPSSIELDALIEKMREAGTEAVVTIDEFGGVDGIVTIEDLIEELVGEVKDEHDERGVAIKPLGRNTWSVSGLLRPDEIGGVIGLALPEDEEFETIGGLMLDLVEEVPKVGKEVVVGAVDRKGVRRSVRLRVTHMDGRRIDRLELTLLPQKDKK